MGDVFFTKGDEEGEFTSLDEEEIEAVFEWLG
jgi:hypothetical protein